MTPKNPQKGHVCCVASVPVKVTCSFQLHMAGRRKTRRAEIMPSTTSSLPPFDSQSQVVLSKHVYVNVLQKDELHLNSAKKLKTV